MSIRSRRYPDSDWPSDLIELTGKNHFALSNRRAPNPKGAILTTDPARHSAAASPSRTAGERRAARAPDNLQVSKLFDVSGKRAFVSGSSKGIGFGLAQVLLAAGAEVVINGRSQASLERAADELTAATGRTPATHAFDVTNEGQVERAIGKVVDTLGGLDIVVNNAGGQFRSPLENFPYSAWQQLIAVNLTSAFLVSRAAARVMIPQRSGKIINICSVQSEAARPEITPYAAAKGGIKMMTKGLCADLGPYGIQVNGLGPGYFKTDLTESLVNDASFNDWIVRRTPAGRWGVIPDLAGALLFLSSAASDFVNGQILYVDGGMLSVL